MRRTLFIIVCLLTFCQFDLAAKPKKLVKHITYEGTLVNKQPSGRCVLYLKDSSDKKLVEGNFNGEVIKDAVIDGIGRFPTATILYSPERVVISPSFDDERIPSDFRPKPITFAYSSDSWGLYSDVSKYNLSKISGGIRLEVENLLTQDKKCVIIYDNGVKVNFPDVKYFSSSISDSFTANSSIGNSLSYTKGKQYVLSLRAKDGSSLSGKLSTEEVYGKEQEKDFNVRIRYADKSEYNGTVSIPGCNNGNVSSYGLDIIGKEYDTFTFSYVNGQYKDTKGNTERWTDGKCILRKKAEGAIGEYTGGHTYSMERWGDTKHVNYEGKLVDIRGDKLRKLLSLDVIGYYHLYGKVNTEVQKHVFFESDEYKNKYLPQMKAELKYMMKDEYVLVYNTEYDTRGFLPYFEYDLDKKVFKFRIGVSREANSMSDKDKYYLVKYHRDYELFFAYPKSLIDLKREISRDNTEWHVVNCETCQVPPEVAARYDKNQAGLKIVFKIEQDGNKCVCVPSHLYIIDISTGATMCDLSDTFKAPNTNFKSYKVKREAPLKKKPYHAKGRIENCGVCLGTGQGWGTPICPFCGGKGWYVEHYW